MGRPVRDSGQSRVPDPPDKMTGRDLGDSAHRSLLAVGRAALPRVKPDMMHVSDPAGVQELFVNFSDTASVGILYGRGGQARGLGA